jgi:hypothetical protein
MTTVAENLTTLENLAEGLRLTDVGHRNQKAIYRLGLLRRTDLQS